MTRTLTFGIALIAIALFTRDVVEPVRAGSNRQQEMRERQCRFQWLDPGIWTDAEERRTAVCVVDHFGGVVGGLPKVISVGACESGWWRFAYNPNGHAGLFQHDVGAWPYRVRSAMPAGWKVGPWERWQNPRSQLVVTVRMVNWDGDWSQWSCA
jgi:hypothetical protein